MWETFSNSWPCGWERDGGIKRKKLNFKRVISSKGSGWNLVYNFKKRNELILKTPEISSKDTSFSIIGSPQFTFYKTFASKNKRIQRKFQKCYGPNLKASWLQALLKTVNKHKKHRMNYNWNIWCLHAISFHVTFQVDLQTSNQNFRKEIQDGNLI